MVGYANQHAGVISARMSSGVLTSRPV